MPIYGYRCRNCGHEFEILQKMSDAALTTCPKCSGPLQKLLYPAGVIFKGSGFYSTDYKGSSSKTSSNGSESSSDNKPSGGQAASESKSEPKTESKPAKSDSDS